VGDFHLLFFASFLALSALGQSRLFGRVSIRSGIPLTADKQAVSGFWREGPNSAG